MQSGVIGAPTCSTEREHIVDAAKAFAAIRSPRYASARARRRSEGMCGRLADLSDTAQIDIGGGVVMTSAGGGRVWRVHHADCGPDGERVTPSHSAEWRGVSFSHAHRVW